MSVTRRRFLISGAAVSATTAAATGSMSTQEGAMTTHNTGNPVGSTAVKDLFDNAQNLDVLVNDRTKPTHADRLGVPRRTWHGIEQEFSRFMDDSNESFQRFLINSGYESLGDYRPGVPINARNQFLWRDAELFRIADSVALPYVTTGDWDQESELFVAVGDRALRQQLADPSQGARMVRGSTIYLSSVADLPDLVATATLFDGQLVAVLSYHPPVFSSNEFYGGGIFAWDSARPKAEHDGGRVVSPTVPWGNIQSFLSGAGETDPSGFGCFVRVAQRLTIEDFGAYQGQSVGASTAVINHAVNVLQGSPLYIPARRYRYNGEITAPVTTLIGERMPNVNSSRTALENGSILEGTFLSRSPYVYIKNLGVDHGEVAFPDTPADAFKVSPVGANKGRSVNLESVVGLGRAPSDMFHAVLIEGYSDVKIRDVVGVRTYYGGVIKGTRVNANNITTLDNGLYGLIIKADTPSGDSADVVVNGFIHDGFGQSGIGLQIESDDDDIRRIMVTGINVRNSRAVCRVTGNVLAGDIVLSGIVGSNITEDAIRQVGVAYSLSVSDVVLAALGGRAANFSDSRHLTVSGFIASAAADNATFSTDFILVGAPSRRTNLVGIDLNSNYSTADGGSGAIKYDNVRGQNVISEGYYRLAGVGAPVSASLTVSVEPTGTSSLETYKTPLIRLTYTSTGPKAHRLLTNNTEQGHRVKVFNSTGGSQVIANRQGSTLRNLSNGQSAEFVLLGTEYVALE